MVRYDALTFDTQVIETNSFHFDGGLLAQLKQFRERPLRVIVSSIVEAEVVQHLADKTRAARDGLQSARKKAADYGLEELAAAPRIDTRALAAQRFEAFLDQCGAEIVTPDNVPLREVVHRYFAEEPPFGKAKKKSEFPDAIALLSLEDWAKREGARVLALSGDADWVAYGKTSSLIDVIDDLAEALELLQEQAPAEEAEALVSGFLTSISLSGDPSARSKFDEMLDRLFAELGIEAVAESSYHVETIQTDVMYSEYEVAADRDEVTIVHVDERSITAQVEFDVTVDVEAELAFSIYDSLDKDYTGIGSADVSSSFTLGVPLLLYFSRESEAEAPASVRLDRIEWPDAPRFIELGYVDPRQERPDDDGYEL